jgi:hypothetical protein
MLVEMEADDFSWLALVRWRLHSVAILELQSEPNNTGRLPSRRSLKDLSTCAYLGLIGLAQSMFGSTTRMRFPFA